jgi:arylamine N-acetyltransferase
MVNWFDGFLQRLGVQAEAPSFDALSQLCYAHLTTHAFYNISKFLKTGRIFPPVFFGFSFTPRRRVW